MKFIYSTLCLSILLVGCQPAPDNSANEAFEKNSETVLSVLDGFQNETLDYSALYATDLIWQGSTFGSEDSLSLEEMIASNKSLWETYDLELDNAVILPGVNEDTKLPDGSVRYYGDWKITLPKTDSTEAKSGVLRGYGTYEFDEEGKIISQAFFADVTGLMMYLNTKE